MRLSIWPNANFIRYTMAHDLKEPGSVQFTRLIEVGLTKDGESLAGAATHRERPKCIVTGGAATMTMSYQGRTFPICCTGCRDEFNENPEKYIKKASLMAGSQAGKAKSGQPAATGVGRFEDAFAGDVVESPAAAKPPPAIEQDHDERPIRPPIPTPPIPRRRPPKPATKNDDQRGRSQAGQPRGLAAQAGQNLEKAGKTTAALGYYRQIVKDFAKTPAAKTAAERIKALESLDD